MVDDGRRSVSGVCLVVSSYETVYAVIYAVVYAMTFAVALAKEITNGQI
jgi:hypothetical protein